MKQRNAPRVGIVSSSRIEGGRVVVDVMFDRPGASKSSIPFFQPFAGGIITPNEGDHVQVYRLNDQSYVAMFPLNGSQYAPTDVGPGELAFSFDADTLVRVKRRGDGKFDVSVAASGDVNISGESVLINGIDFEQHAHAYTDDGAQNVTGTPQ
ncbi:hypothetical protein [Halobellus limi]|uniref:Phage baseplate assembly protein V n=2 Tax=Halobellus limi TaxID=699433 RepID=A0A4D6H2D3_9EURY|nr:hypothetical protein [Halobellus limi]QCC48079.1 hypothetical protein DV707_10645 [Halobellus limi]